EPERGESEASHTQPAERLRVGAAGQAVRDGLASRLFGLQRADHRRAQIAVERGLHPDVMLDELALYVRPEQPVDLGQELLFAPGQETAVDVGAGRLGYHVHLVPR